MKTLAAFLPLLFCCFYGFAQSPQQGRVTYQFSHIRDTITRSNVLQDEMMLEFTPALSYFRSYTHYKWDSLRKATPIANGEHIKIPKYAPYKIVTRLQKEEQFDLKPSMGSALAVPEPHVLQWEVLEQQKVIGGFQATLARTRFKGRLYNAWFTPEVPVSAGPWKLYGLPGLILEAEDSTGTVKWTFAGLSNASTGDPLDLPRDARIITKKEWEETQAAILKDPQGYANAQLQAIAAKQQAEMRATDPSATMSMSVKIDTGSAGALQKRAGTKMNNPIELTVE